MIFAVLDHGYVKNRMTLRPDERETFEIVRELEELADFSSRGL